MTKQILALISLESVRLGFAVATLLLSRWIMELSSPSKDWRTFQEWLDSMRFVWQWYAGREGFHQMRGLLILRRAYKNG